MSNTKRLAENGRLQIFGMEYPWLRLTATSTGQRLPEKCIVIARLKKQDIANPRSSLFSL